MFKHSRLAEKRQKNRTYEIPGAPAKNPREKKKEGTLLRRRRRRRRVVVVVV